MRKVTIGLIRNTRSKDRERSKFEKAAKKIGVELVVFNVAEKIDLDRLRSRAASCEIILNDEVDYISTELAKTLECLGHWVSEKTSTFYYTEDKWLQYVKCVKHNVPVPKTVLLPTDLVSAKQQLKDFNQWPIVLKRIFGFAGMYVDRANSAPEAIEIIRKFWKKGEKLCPIIAQEFVNSDSYRVVTIGGKVVQTAVKKSIGWKQTGCSAVRFWKFKVDAELQTIIDELQKITDLAVCGYDFAKHHGKWVLIEINALPSYRLYNTEYDMLIEHVLKYHKKLVLNRKRKVTG